MNAFMLPQNCACFRPACVVYHDDQVWLTILPPHGIEALVQ